MAAIVVAGGVLAGIIASAGCTFGGLANYEIQECVPGKPQAEDVCNQLKSADPCTPYQCDSTRHCVQKTRDDDRDGDPPVNCGGNDCDDTNAARSSTAKEICDGIDNNCNDLIDEDVVVAGVERALGPPLQSGRDFALVPSDDIRRNALGAFISGSCIPFVTLEPGGGAAVGGCAVNDATIAPHQPYPLIISTGSATAFIATTVCPQGRLAYRTPASGELLDMPCDAAHPAALPALAAMPSSANANSGIIAWYEAALPSRSDPLGGCAAATPAPLAVLAVPILASPPKAPTQANVLVASETSIATRPPALLPIEPAGGMLLTTPLGADVGVFLLKPSTLVGTSLPSPTHIPLANARSTAVASRIDGGAIHIAVAAEIGCRPQAGIQLAIGTLDATSGALKFETPIEVAATSALATAPSVAWVASRSEWWVGWIDATPRARIRRFTATGKPVTAKAPAESAIDVGTQLLLAMVSAGESVYGINPAVNGGSFVEIPVGCPTK